VTLEWEQVKAWRRARREERLARRAAVPKLQRDRQRDCIVDLIDRHVSNLAGHRIGFYWPFKAEIDLRPFVRALVKRGSEAALPVVVEKAGPLEFWDWRPGMKLGRGVWNIPIPDTRNPVEPTALLVPLVGFDDAGYRLGYGGGYYDRTLAAMPVRPLLIAVGLAACRLSTIHPQPHDIAMDAVVTEEAFRWVIRSSVR
jgi:5-formyltetrahydrofolate cyclo-ligase